MDPTIAAAARTSVGTHRTSGSAISHYRIVEPLGRGGMGEVYKAEDTRLGRFVALKFLSAALTQDPNALGRLRREARATSALNHPNICAIHDIDESGAQPFLVMEFLEGHTLKVKNAGRPQALPEILNVARQVAAALEASHDKQIIHRDIKPSNVMITSRGEVKVLDFGLAKISRGPSSDVTTEMTEVGTVLGTINYMSPEQALGRPADTRSDLFSLGVMLYEMATGRLPFSGSTAMETLNQIINAEPEAVTRLNVNIPPGLERIISRCLEKNAEYRFQSAGDLLTDLGKADPDTARLNRRGIRNNLPQPLSRFIGRQGEIAALQQLLSGTRLLTLAGSGGIGKTRLALEVAAASLESYEDGVWFVELAVLADEAFVPQTVGAAFGVREERGRSITNTLVDYLQRRTLLLVLDNCEHVVGASAQLADTLLRAAPGLRIVATSREALAITGETLFRVPSLDEAVELFVDRARLVNPAFELTDQNAPVLAKICARLEGIPLAIELAASRVRVMSVEQVEARLEDRLSLLTGGSRTALPRHQTVRAAIDWSYQLLGEAEQMLFRRLSVFSGGWTLEAAEAVCAGNARDSVSRSDMLELLSGLVDKSLVVTEERDHEQRYQCLATLQQYGNELLVDTPDGVLVLRRHAKFFLGLVEEAAQKLKGPDQLAWHARLIREYGNVRAVLNWSLEGYAEVGLRVAGSLEQFWQITGYLSEARTWLDALLAQTDALKHAVERARALSTAGGIARYQGDYVAARSFSEEALTIARELGERSEIARALGNLGMVAMRQGDYARARALYDESLAIFRELGNEHGIAQMLGNLGIVIDRTGDYAGARVFHEESLAIRRKLGDKFGIANSLNNLGVMAEGRGDFNAAAWRLHEESLAIRRELGDKQGIAYSLGNLGTVAVRRGDYAAARSLFEESLAILRDIGDKQGISYSLSDLGVIAERQGHYELAGSLHQESLAIRRELGDKFGITISLGNLGTLAERQQDFTTARAVLEEGLAIRQELGNKDGIADGLRGLGRVVGRLGDYSAARSLLEESLTLCRDFGDRADVAGSLEDLAAVSLAESQQGRAVRLWAAGDALRELTAAPRAPSESDACNAGINAARSSLGEQAFMDAWAQGHTMTRDQAIAYALKQDGGHNLQFEN